MCLHDTDGMTGAIREATRVLQPSGPWPWPSRTRSTPPPTFPPGLSASMVITSYLDAAPADWTLDRDGLQVRFHSEHRPLGAYASALASAAC